MPLRSGIRATAGQASRSVAVVLFGMGLAGAMPAALNAQNQTPSADRAPIPLFPPEPETSPAEDPQPAPKSPPAEAIVVKPLTAPTTDSIGLTDPGGGQFSAELWADSPRSHIAALIRLLPSGSRLPTAAELERQLLIVPAKPPQGNSDSPSLLALRAERLFAAGQTETADSLLQRAGTTASGPDLAELRAKLALLHSDPRDACLIAATIPKQGTDPFWLKLSALCAAWQGDQQAVQINLGLLAETDEQGDQAFVQLVSRIGERGASSPERARNPAGAQEQADLSPIDLALYRTLKINPSEQAVSGASLPVLRAVANADQIDPALRILAGERAAAAGALAPMVLARVYGLAAFSNEQLRDAATSAEKLSPPLGNALLFQAITQVSDASTRLGLLGAALKRARAQDIFPLAAQIYAGPVMSIPAVESNLGFASTAGQCLLAAGRPDEAFAWYLLAQSQTKAGAEEANSAVRNLWPIFALYVPASRFASGPQDTVDWAHETSLDRVGAKAELLGLLEAVGRPVPAEAWWAIFDPATESPGVKPQIPLKRLLAASASAGQVGETILEALVLVGTRGAGVPDPGALPAAVAALRGIGQEDAARRLARDAAIAVLN